MLPPRLHALHTVALTGLFVESGEAEVMAVLPAPAGAARTGSTAAGSAGSVETAAFRELLRGCGPEAVAALLGEPETRFWFHIEFVPHCAWWYDGGRLQLLFGGDGTVIGLYRAPSQ